MIELIEALGRGSACYLRYKLPLLDALLLSWLHLLLQHFDLSYNILKCFFKDLRDDLGALSLWLCFCSSRWSARLRHHPSRRVARWAKDLGQVIIDYGGGHDGGQ